MPLTAIDDFDKSPDPVLQSIAEIVNRNNGLWSVEAENYLLEKKG